MIVALDVGSTNSRAWLIEPRPDAAPIVHARATEGVGVRDAALASNTTPVHDAVQRLIADVSRVGRPTMIAGAGMITSPLGLRDVPHLLAPAGLPDLAAALVRYDDPTIADLPIVLVPGVRTGGQTTLAVDVMRGEETLVIGLLSTGLASPGMGVLNAGSHWKFIQIDESGRIASSRTTLGGEVVHAVAAATLLASAVPSGPLLDIDEHWLARGAEATEEHGLLRALFGVRLLQLEGATSPRQRHAFLVGATVAADLRALLEERILADRQPLLVTGPPAMAAAWVHLLARAGFGARALSAEELESAFLAGLSVILRTAGFVDNRERMGR